jgi:hypothetical protein
VTDLEEIISGPFKARFHETLQSGRGSYPVSPEVDTGLPTLPRCDCLIYFHVAVSLLEFLVYL